MAVVYRILPFVEDSERLTRLFTELTCEDTHPDTERINLLISEGSLIFYSAWLDGLLVGMASVIPCRTSISDKLWIEDVAVLNECRGKGIGRGLLEFALNDATGRFGTGTFWLTSRPSRIPARKLYESMGFIQYETGVFKKICPKEL